MSKTIDFYYDYISPASYFAWVRLQEIAARHGAKINYKPMLLGGVFKAHGNLPPISVPAKFEWMKKDFARTAEYYSIPYRFNPHFIFNTVSAMRGAMWAQTAGRLEDYNQAMYQAAWADGKDISDAAVIQDVLTNAGFDVDEIQQAIAQPDIKQALISATDAAVERGVFGAPTMFVDDEIFFGQDRLDSLERTL